MARNNLNSLLEVRLKLKSRSPFRPFLVIKSSEIPEGFVDLQIDGKVQDCSISTAIAMGTQQSCKKSLK